MYLKHSTTYLRCRDFFHFQIISAFKLLLNQIQLFLTEIEEDFHVTKMLSRFCLMSQQ